MVINLSCTSENFIANFKNKGYNPVLRKNFNTPEGSKATFPFCCGMFYKSAYLNPNGSDIKDVISQYCIRTDNFSRIGISHKHLSFFEMLGLFDFRAKDLTLPFEHTVNYLIGVVDSSLLSANIPDSKSLNVKKLESVLRDKGINLVKLRPEELRWKMHENILKQGFRIELNYEKDGRKTELWNISCITNPDGSFIYDSGVCCERLNIAQNGLETIFECPEILYLKESIKEIVDPGRNSRDFLLESLLDKPFFEKPLEDSELNLLTDLVRTSQYLLSSGIKKLGKKNKKGMHTRSIIKKLLTFSHIYDVNLDKLKELFPEEVRGIMDREIELFCQNMQLSSLEARFHILRKSEPPEKFFKLIKHYRRRSKNLDFSELTNLRRELIGSTSLKELSEQNDIAPLEVLLKWCIINNIQVEKPNDINNKLCLREICKEYKLNQNILNWLKWV